MTIRVICLNAATAALLVTFAGRAPACDGFVVGRKASRTGRVLVAHNEDNYLTHKVRHALIPSGAPLFDEPGRVRIPQAERTYACFWSELKSVNADRFPGDVFLNENGVIVYSNNGGDCTNWNGTAWSLPEEGEYSTCTDGGLGINLRFAVAQRARTAREGVRIMTELVDRWGYEPLSRIYTIADKDEAWLVQVIHGRRYVARRCPDDEVAAYPNCLTIGRIRPDDICSPNIRAKGNDFDFAAFYQGPRTWQSPVNRHRGLDLYRIVAGREVDSADGYPFSVKPIGPIAEDDVKRGLRSHYEGTSYEVLPRHPDEDRPTLAPICRLSTLESLVCAFGDKPCDLILHLATGRPCTTPYWIGRPFAGELPADVVRDDDAIDRLRGNFRLPTASGFGWDGDPAAWRIVDDGLVSRANVGYGGFAVSVTPYARTVKVRANVRPIAVGRIPSRLGLSVYDNPEDYWTLALIGGAAGERGCELAECRHSKRGSQNGLRRVASTDGFRWREGAAYVMELELSGGGIRGRILSSEGGEALYACEYRFDGKDAVVCGNAALYVDGDFAGEIDNVEIETAENVCRAECPEPRYETSGSICLHLGARLCAKDDEWSIIPSAGCGTGVFPNVFHREFGEACDWLAREVCTIHRKDPWLAGYYLDDCLRWPEKNDILRLAEDHSARRALMEFAGGRDLSEEVWAGFRTVLQERYLTTLRAAVDRYDPRHPVLGVLRQPAWD